jgi:hypothetical protein
MMGASEATLIRMCGDSARDYFLGRARSLVEREAMRQEWEFLARAQREHWLVDHVGHGWQPTVLSLHRRLLTIDRDYQLFRVREVYGALVYDARFDPGRSPLCRRLLALARAEAGRTCEVCAAAGRLRDQRPILKTLCDACFAGDRVAAAARGERYARLVLDHLMSADPRHPDPDETLAWLAQDGR